MTPEWAVLVEVLRELGAQPHAVRVGHTVFPTICYVVTEMRVATGFHFVKGSYGPFSSEVKPALQELMSRGWIQEEKLGRLLALRAGAQYEHDHASMSETIEPHAKKIAKVTDLFSRIKTTEQAGEVLSVLFASRQFKQAHPKTPVTEQQLYDLVLEWKTAWTSDEKRRALASAIRHLVLLEWVQLSPSESLGRVLGVTASR